MGDKMEPKKHNPLFIAMAILVCLLFVLTLIVNGLAGSIGITWGKTFRFSLFTLIFFGGKLNKN